MNVFRFAVSALVTVALCAWLLSVIEPSAVIDRLRAIDRPLFAAFVGLSFGGLFVRAWRYFLLLDGRASYRALVLVTAARNCLVDLLPARVGSLSYIYLLKSRVGVDLEPILSSFVLSFLYDLIAMALLIAVALSLQFGAFEGAAPLSLLLAIFAAGVAAAFFLLEPALRIAGKALGRSTRFSPVASRVAEVADEVAAMGRGRRALGLVTVSFAIRGLKFGAHWVLLLAILHAAPSELPFWRVFLGIAAAELSATLPIHGLMGFGTYEAAWSLSFERLGMSAKDAVESGFATHILSQAFDYSLGALAIAVLMLAWRRRT